MTIRSAIRLFLGLAVGLPVLQTLLFWVSGLLAAMGDEAAANFIQRLNLAAAVAWLASLVGLVILVAIIAVTVPTVTIDEEEPLL
jgi:hypothetical protein